MLLSVSHIHKAYGETVILPDVSFTMERGDHFALVGRNGSGKSTLLNIIVGDLRADEGVVSLEKDATVGYLPQYLDMVMEGSLYDFVLHAREDILEDEKKMASMEDAMKTASGDELNRLLEDYQSFSHIFEMKGGTSYRSQVEGALFGLGFTREDFGRDTDTLSGGQKTRLSLARILMGSPDLLILDEPINHLDLKSIEWLEGFLSSYKGAVLLVAHDRYFLNRVTDHILSLYDDRARVYRGNYQAFADQRENELITRSREVEKQQKEIEHQEAVIKKLQQFNREKSIKRAESRKKMLDKVEVIEDFQEEAIMRPVFTASRPSGKDVLSVNGISKGFDGNNLFSNVSFEVKKGERVAILGDNGTGKTTLLREILSYPFDSGLDSPVRFGMNVDTGYFDQAQKNLNPAKSVMDEVHDAFPQMTDGEVRQKLAGFLFTGDRIYDRIETLSGGEKARVSLTKLMLGHFNFLILDEPTNHLDMESKEALEGALRDYDGTILFVSHDRYFVNRVATRILELYNGHLIEYLGNYDYYVKKREEFHRTFAESPSGSPLPDRNISHEEVTESSGGKADWQKAKEEKAARQKLEREQAKVEEDIATAEGRIKAIDEEFLKPEYQTNSKKLRELTEEQDVLKERLEDLYSRWEALAEQL